MTGKAGNAPLPDAPRMTTWGSPWRDLDSRDGDPIVIHPPGSLQLLIISKNTGSKYVGDLIVYQQIQENLGI